MNTTHWADEAVCRQVDPDLWFGDRGASPQPPKRICASCPVRAECLQDALDTGDLEYGIRGGLAPKERRKLTRRAAA